MKKYLSMMFCLLLVLSPVQVLANSAQTDWRGVDATGALVVGEESPIIVEHEELVFEIQEFPQEYYSEDADFLAYAPSATARYTFYNPSDYTVTARLAFPFGAAPDYSANYYDAIDAEKYGVSVDGVSIEKQVRHTLTDLGGSFDVERDIPLLYDDYVEDEFYRPDLPVTMYVFEPNVDLTKYESAYAAIDLSFDEIKTRAFLKYGNGASTTVSAVRLGEFVDEGDQYVLYVMGEQVELEPWKFYTNGGTTAQIDGTMELLYTMEMTFEELVMEKYPEGDVSKTDWYNAVVASANRYQMAHGVIGMEFILNGEYNVRRFLMQWFYYEISLEPGQRMVNQVTVPMYPAIDADYEPPVYNYTYLLSPASTWAEFGTLDITVNTPYNLVGEPSVAFEKTTSGYAVSLEGLPEGELEFTLSTVENPEQSKVDILYAAEILLRLGWPLIVIVAGIVVIRRSLKNRKKEE